MVAVPLHGARERERGFNQVELVLSHLPETLRCLVERDVLARVRNTPPQTHLSRQKRLKNMEGAFAVHNRKSLQETHIILIDDVTTTGTTLSEAAHTLTRAGAEVDCLAFAHA